MSAMYAVAREHRSTKFLVKTRRAHIPQKLDTTFDTPIRKDAQELQLKEQLCTISPPLFTEKRFQLPTKNAAQEISAQHEAMIRYIHSSWHSIKQELEHSLKLPNGTPDNYVNGNINNGVLQETASKIKYTNGCSLPKNFVPFDLESFWGQRIYQNLLRSS